VIYIVKNYYTLNWETLIWRIKKPREIRGAFL